MNSEALYCTKKEMIVIPTDSELFIQIQDVCYVLKAFTNLISMGILKRCGWSYLNEDNHMGVPKMTPLLATLTPPTSYVDTPQIG